MKTDCHKEYGFTDEFRLKVLHRAEIVGVATAAKEFNIHQNSIWNWRKRVVEKADKPTT